MAKTKDEARQPEIQAETPTLDPKEELRQKVFNGRADADLFEDRYGEKP